MTLAVEIPENELKNLSAYLKKHGGNIISVDDDGFTESELNSVKQGLHEALLIKKGELKPLSMSDLWDE